ncbi:asparagine synthase (glutamine-hydrolyzing) [Tumebacillus flagellatus]|uniref:asparagine synthase (glutamine-hydrolyzing) n=1 Tax=Tumebacillus flagellatus TaxID=1157490 RepID=A0A074LP89_9BACL|nr:asparagine synthase (glutamine-hydrolyzing) [Tumebacillus flagellatus]KEO82320.1 hypothetical protein EL26_16205 [Tumebacillus flagellatus]
MTGLTGFLDWKQRIAQPRELLRSMSQPLDVVHTHYDAHAAMASSSLAGSDGVTVAVWGYLYNQEELTRDLQSAGHRFQGRELPELFHTAFLHWGDSFVERLAGAFAFAIWDAREQRLLLGRDHIGMKNLYVSDRGDSLAFGTEIKMVLEHPDVTRNVAADGLIELLAKGPYFSPGQAVFADVRELLPGHLLICTPHGTRTHPYWNVQSRPHEHSIEETVHNIDSLLQSHVIQWGNLPTPPTVILSGGLDSSGLTAMMHRFFGHKHPDWKSFSGNTKETYNVENAEDMDFTWVKRVAEHLGMQDEEFLFDLDALWEINHIPRRAHDLPTEAKYEASTYQIYRKIGEQYSVIVSGEGSDEMFASMYWFYRDRQAGDPKFPWLAPQTSILASPALLETLQASDYLHECGLRHLREVPTLPGEDEPNRRMRELAYFTLKEYLPYNMRHNERMAAAAGVQLRMPFVDPRLAQYAWNIPWEMKNHNDQPKGILRRTFRNYLPDFIVDRKKSNVPMVFQSSYPKRLHEAAEAILRDPQAPLYDLIDREHLRKILDEKTIERDMYMRWRLDYYLQIDSWMREYRVQLRV